MKLRDLAGVRERIHGLLIFSVLVCGVGGICETDLAMAQTPGDDLFANPYVYLLRGDENFNKLTPDYTYTVPTPDSAFQVDAFILPKGSSDATADTSQYLAIRLGRTMAIRLIYTDSSRAGLAMYDFPRVPAGNYALAAIPCPESLRGMISGRSSVSIYLLADKKYQGTFRFDAGPECQILRAVRTQFPAKK